MEDSEDNEIALHDRLEFFNYAIVRRKMSLFVLSNERKELSAVDP